MSGGQTAWNAGQWWLKLPKAEHEELQNQLNSAPLSLTQYPSPKGEREGHIMEAIRNIGR